MRGKPLEFSWGAHVDAFFGDLTFTAMSDLDTVATHYGIPADAVLHLLEALRRGGGHQAQFNHPALGGMGQWNAGGMLMIGDMFNDALKAKVAALCADLASLVGQTGGELQGTSEDAWWPAKLGSPASAGSQNGVRYAVFPGQRRLAIQAGDGARVALYDTGEHRISGVSQQQSTGRDLTFTSQLGVLRTGDLSVVGSN